MCATCIYMRGVMCIDFDASTCACLFVCFGFGLDAIVHCRVKKMKLKSLQIAGWNGSTKFIHDGLYQLNVFVIICCYIIQYVYMYQAANLFFFRSKKISLCFSYQRKDVGKQYLSPDFIPQRCRFSFFLSSSFIFEWQSGLHAHFTIRLCSCVCVRVCIHRIHCLQKRHIRNRNTYLYTH